MRAVSPRLLVVGGLLAVGCVFVALAFVLSGGSSNLPDGWKSFSAGPFKGGVQRDWIVTYVDFDSYNPSGLPDGIPADFPEKLAAMQASGAFEGILLVFFERDPGFATQLNIVSCEPAASVDLIDTLEDVINLYGRNFVKAEPVGKVAYNGAEFDLIQLFQLPQYDTYQVYLRTDDCYTALNLTTRSGDRTPIDALHEFLAHLEIDADRLR
jgi:hypothetical protein